MALVIIISQYFPEGGNPFEKIQPYTLDTDILIPPCNNSSSDLTRGLGGIICFNKDTNECFMPGKV